MKTQLCVFLALFFLLALLPRQAAAQPAEPGLIFAPPSSHVYYRVITIDYTRGTQNVQNYVVHFVLDTATLISAGKMRSDCGDVRFYDQNGNQLSYWIGERTCNTASTWFFVRLTSLTAGSIQQIFMAYGNSALTSAADPGIFLYADTFSSNTLSSYVQAASGWSISGGYLVSPGTSNIDNFICRNIQLPRSDGYEIIARIQLSSSDSGVGFISCNSGGGQSSVNGYIANYHASSSFSNLRKYSGGSYTSLANLPYGLSGWHIVEVIANSTKIVVRRNGAVDAVSTDTSVTTLPGFGFRQAAASFQAVDWYVVKRYVYPEPAVSVSGEASSRQPKLAFTLSFTYNVQLLDASMNVLLSSTLAAGKWYVLASNASSLNKVYYIKLNGTLLAPALALNNTVLAPPGQSAPVAFTIQDYGFGYELLQAFDLQGRLAASAPVTALRQAAVNLTPYNTYTVQLCKGTQLCKSVGLIAVTSQNIVLTVMPSVPEVKPPSWVSAEYDYDIKALVVNVSCSAPPCTVRIEKKVVWHNIWQMRMAVSLQAGWNLVFLKKSSTISGSGVWAYINASSWSEIRFGDDSGLPERFLQHSVIWSNATHAQVLVYASTAGTYYLYWQPRVAAGDASQPHPFIACYENVCGLRFNGLYQYAESWSSKNWYPSGEGAIIDELLFFSNDTVNVISVYATDPRFRVLAGQLAYDSTLGRQVLYVPVGTSGYVAEVSLGEIGGGPFQLTRYAKASASGGTLRIEVYEDDVKIGEYTSSPGTSYGWSEGGAWLARQGRSYTLRVWWSGTADLYLDCVQLMNRRGSVGAGNFYAYITNGRSLSINTILPDGSMYVYYTPIYFSPGEHLTYAAVANSTHRAVWRDGQLAGATAVSGGIRAGTYGFWVGGSAWWYFYGLKLRVLAYNRSLTPSEAASVTAGGEPPLQGLFLRLEARPEYLYDVNWDGTVDWLDLSGSGNHLRLVNYHKQGSFTAVWQRQPSDAVTAVYTCNAQKCGYTIYDDDPYFSVSATDAGGKTASAYTGMSVPLWHSPLSTAVNWLGKTMNLDAWGVNVNDFIVLLLGLGIIYAAFTFKNWELSIIVFGVWLSVGSLLLGGSGKLVLPGFSLAVFGAAISYMLRRESESG